LKIDNLKTNVHKRRGGRIIGLEEGYVALGGEEKKQNLKEWQFTATWGEQFLMTRAQLEESKERSCGKGWSKESGSPKKKHWGGTGLRGKRRGLKNRARLNLSVHGTGGGVFFWGFGGLCVVFFDGRLKDAVSGKLRK